MEPKRQAIDRLQLSTMACALPPHVAMHRCGLTLHLFDQNTGLMAGFWAPGDTTRAIEKAWRFAAECAKAKRAQLG